VASRSSEVNFTKNYTLLYLYLFLVYGILIGTYTRPTQQCRLEWPWVTLSHLAKYSMTRNVARSLCDSWASCNNVYNNVCPPSWWAWLLQVRQALYLLVLMTETSQKTLSAGHGDYELIGNFWPGIWDPWGCRPKRSVRDKPASLSKISAKSVEQFRRRCVANSQTNLTRWPIQ